MSFRIEKVAEIHVTHECHRRERSRSPVPPATTRSALASAMLTPLVGGLQNIHGDWLIPARHFRIPANWKSFPLKLKGVVFDSDGNRIQVESTMRLSPSASEAVNGS